MIGIEARCCATLMRRLVALETTVQACNAKLHLGKKAWTTATHEIGLVL